MKIYFNTIVLIFSTSLLFSQSGSLSPYSFFGVGDNTFKGTIENRSMGGLNIYSDSVHLNLTNPAAFSELKYVNYSVGVDYNNFNLISDNSNEKATTANMNYLAVAIPTKKLAFGFGIMPKSSVGYLLQSTDNSTEPKQVNRYEGNISDGTIQNIYLQPTKSGNYSLEVGIYSESGFLEDHYLNQNLFINLQLPDLSVEKPLILVKD